MALGIGEGMGTAARANAARGGGTQASSAEAVMQNAIAAVRRVMRRWLWLLLGLGILVTLIAMTMILIRFLVVRTIPYTLDEDSLVSSVIYLAIAMVAFVTFLHLQSTSINKVARHVAERLAVPAVLATAQRAGRPETLSNQAIREVETIRSTIAGPTSEVLLGAVLTPLFIIIAFYMHWALGAVSVIFCLWAGALSLLIARAKRESSDLSGQDRTRAFGLAADAMRSGEAVLAMGMLAPLTRQWVAVGTASSEEVWVKERRAAGLRAWMETVLNSYRLLLILVATFLTMAGDEHVAKMIGACFILMRIPDPFATLGDNAHELGEGLSAWRRLRGLVEQSPMPPEGLAFPCPQGRLVVERLSFAWRGAQTPLLRNLELTVEPGEVIGIIGASGSGKSTLLRVLIGMYRPNTGGVYLDGQATHQWDRQEIARHMGFLPQDALLSRGTAAEVIARLEEPNMRLVLDAAKRAGAHETIIGLPLGYATPLIGPYQLSGGQRHRIALARALYGRPRVLVLDELAGALDPEGEAQVARLLGVLREEGTSVIFSTHRPGLIGIADRVLALRNGVLIPAGEEPQRRLASSRARLTAAPRGGPRETEEQPA